MTFDSIRVEHYMTKFSFLTAFFSVRVCVSAAKTPYLLPRGAVFNIFCAVFM